MTPHHFHQRPHLRHSTRGKRYVAGRRAFVPGVPQTTQRQILHAEHDALIKELKAHKRAKLPDIGIFTLKAKPAVPGGKKAINPFTQQPYLTHAKPARRIVRFRAAQALLEAVQ